MNNATKIALGIGGLIVIVAIIFALSAEKDSSTKNAGDSASELNQLDSQSDGDAMMEKENGDKMEGDTMEDDSTAGDAMEKEGGDKMEAKPDQEEAMEQKNAGLTTLGTYQDYSATLAASESGAANNVVLFFHAAWCPTCKTADAAFKNNKSNLPNNTALLKVDYDSSDDLKKKYGVTYQHTFVQIDANGNEITKWVGGDVSKLKTQIR